MTLPIGRDRDRQRRHPLGARRVWARSVAAGDDARRRLERELHDGAQQRLVSLALRLRTAEAALPCELRAVKEQIDDAITDLAGVCTDLREIFRGIHPTIVSHGGLGPALEKLARRSAVPVRLDVAVGAPIVEIG